jgi:LacI family transcriptional regulator
VKRPTRTDVARLAGTSTAVVSYVINDGPRGVSPERRERVLAAMKELGYQPNAIARSLSSARTNTIGMIVPNISNGYFAELALAVEEAAMERGLLVFLGNSSELRSREGSYATSFVSQRVDGVIVVGVDDDSPAVRPLLDAGVPVVALDRVAAGGRARGISIDHQAAAYAATRHLVEHGYRRIWCLTGPAGQSVADQRLDGWAAALRDGGLAPEEQQVSWAPFSLEGGIDGYRSLPITSRDDLTALFAASDEQARGVITEAGRRGVVVPRDLAIASVDGTREGTFSNPPLTSVRQPFADLAREAIAALVRRSTGPPVILDAQLRLGRSCGCP